MAAQMDRLRDRLRTCSEQLGKHIPNGANQSSNTNREKFNRLASVAPGVFVCLIDDSNIFVFQTSSTGQKSFLLDLDSPLPPGSRELIPSPAEHGVFAVCAERGAAVVEWSSKNGSSARVVHVGAPTFRLRPGLKILHGAWSPHTDAFFALLTSDGNLRMFDVSSKQSANVDRFRLRVVTAGAGPISFAFGRAKGWDSLSLYVLAEDGAMYVASPIALPGSKISTKTWNHLLLAAKTVLGKDKELFSNGTTRPTSTPIANTNDGAVQTDALESFGFDAMAKRQLEFSPSHQLPPIDETEDGEVQESWNAKQAKMQIRFLQSVFAGSRLSPEMVVVKEFNMAQPLFQGPFYVEQDDSADLLDAYSNAEDDEHIEKFVELVLLQRGVESPPVFLRSTSNGETSVLIQLESVDAQWDLGSKSAGDGSSAFQSDNDYAECARISAPSLLCFEHLSFPGNNPVSLFPLLGKADFNAMFGVSASMVYSVRLPFTSLLNDPSALENCPVSSVTPVLDMAPCGGGGGEAHPESCILGIALSFERGTGLVSFVLDSNFRLSVTPPLRWTINTDQTLLVPVTDNRPGAELAWGNGEKFAGNRGFACQIGREVMGALREIREIDESQNLGVAEGTLTSISQASSVSALLDYMEKRAAICVGSDVQSGVGDVVANAAKLVREWLELLEPLSRANIRRANVVEDEFNTVKMKENNLRRKVERANELNENLRDRIQVLREIIESGTGLSAAERERKLRLKERKRRIITLRKRLCELSEAVNVYKKEESGRFKRESIPATPDRNSASKYSNGWSGSAQAWKTSPLERRREEWTAADQKITLNKNELEKVKKILEVQSRDITQCHEISKSLWQKLNST